MNYTDVKQKGKEASGRKQRRSARLAKGKYVNSSGAAVSNNKGKKDDVVN